MSVLDLPAPPASEEIAHLRAIAKAAHELGVEARPQDGDSAYLPVRVYLVPAEPMRELLAKIAEWAKWNEARNQPVTARPRRLAVACVDSPDGQHAPVVDAGSAEEAGEPVCMFCLKPLETKNEGAV